MARPPLVYLMPLEVEYAEPSMSFGEESSEGVEAAFYGILWIFAGASERAT